MGDVVGAVETEVAVGGDGGPNGDGLSSTDGLLEGDLGGAGADGSGAGGYNDKVVSNVLSGTQFLPLSLQTSGSSKVLVQPSGVVQLKIVRGSVQG